MSPTEPTSAPPLTEKSREVRLGLVLYGGVSLAIYINGVCHEFFRAVRGQGVYRLIKALTDSDVVVDVISGTSAGGINGIFLAYALCNEGADFKQSAPLWSEHGDIRKLLRKPDDTGEGVKLSLLNTENYYEPELVQALLKIHNSGTSPAARSSEDSSPIRRLDLFITGTDVDGHVSTQFDDAGHPIDVKDHRTVFSLKHRAGRKDKQPFKPLGTTGALGKEEVTVKALAKLACITSCFPAAFRPVMVKLGNWDPQGEVPPTADDLLQRWGGLSSRPGMTQRCFLDGGVLDNKPFSYTIQSIFAHHAVREVDRKLCYVEPDPELFKQEERKEEPNALQAVLAAVAGIPRYESIGDDLQLLTEHNNRVLQFDRIVQALQSGRVRLGPPTQAQQTLYCRSRLVSLSERVLRGLLRERGQDPVLHPAGVGAQEKKAQEHRDVAARLALHFERAPVDTRLLFEELDVSFRLRRLYHTVYTLYDHLYAGGKEREPQELERHRALLRTLNRQIELHELLQGAMGRLIDEAPINWFAPMKEAGDDDPLRGCGMLWNRVTWLWGRLLDEHAAPAAVLPRKYIPQARRPGGEWLEVRGADAAEQPLQRFGEELRDLSAAIVNDVDKGRGGDALPRPWHGLLRRFAAYEQGILDDFVPERGHPVRRAYEDFGLLDAVLFPLEAVGGAHEKDVIETIRISPRDAAKGFSAKELERKVAGDAVYHFGGFFKRSWRSNDILWGRLDGLCQLVETLLDRERLKRVTASPTLRETVRRRLFSPAAGSDARTLQTLFPHSGAPTRAELEQWLKDLLSEGDERTRESALEPKRFEYIQALLIEAAQLEVLVEEVPHVIDDALLEQTNWNQFQLAPPVEEKELEKPTPPPWMFVRGKRRLDPLVQVTGAAELARQRFEQLRAEDQQAPRPAETALGKYFTSHYGVGEERLRRDMPQVALLNILTTAMLVLNNCVLGILGENAAQRIRRSPLYLFGVYLPLRALHGFLLLLRKEHALATLLVVATGVLSLFALAVGGVWWDEIIAPDNEMHLRLVLLFFALPVLLLGAIVLYLWKLSAKKPQVDLDESERDRKKGGRGATPSTPQGVGLLGMGRIPYVPLCVGPR